MPQSHGGSGTALTQAGVQAHCCVLSLVPWCGVWSRESPCGACASVHVCSHLRVRMYTCPIESATPGRVVGALPGWGASASAVWEAYAHSHQTVNEPSQYFSKCIFNVIFSGFYNFLGAAEGKWLKIQIFSGLRGS